MFFVAGDNWQLGARCSLVGANLCLGSAGRLRRDPVRDRRRRTSATGSRRAAGRSATSAAACCWPANLVAGHAARSSDIDRGHGGPDQPALAPAIWWAAFTLIPFRGIRNRPPVNVVPEPGGLVRQSFGQLLAHAEGPAQLPDDADLPARLPVLQRRHPDRHLRRVDVRREGARLRAPTVLIATILLVQFVAFGGALLFGRLAERARRHQVILAGLVMWMVVVIGRAASCPTKNLAAVPRAGGRDRAGARRHPGAVPVVLQPADPPRPGGGVLQPLPGLRARHGWLGTLVFGAGAPVDRLLPAGALRADRASSSSAASCCSGWTPSAASGRRQRRSRRGLTVSLRTAVTPAILRNLVNAHYR